MIRFIDLGKQIAVDETDPDWPRQFAFFDTIYNRFVTINGYAVFDSMADLMSEMQQDDAMTPEFGNRLFGLMPDWARRIEVPHPRHGMQVFGIK